MKVYHFLIALLFTFSVSAQDLNSFFTETNSFLNKHVSKGKVDYANIHKDQSEIDELLKIASGITVKVSDANNYKAFWINAYNISVIKGIIDNYPTKSPLDNAGFFDKTTYSLGGKTITLNDIEHKLLRGNFKDARFHFVLVCGALGCPPLISEAYMPNTLEAQLDKQTKVALNGSFLKVNTKKKKVEASEIMKWYKEDFTMDGITEIEFINKYRTEKIPENFKLTYFTYNWNLNKQ
ncbi:DUF547 domain-containing protein [Winogradskyella endarachnes]|uniref:DUF547 domain-containing protein n=1 Tax=Winogradskyella endarachnes TaxID=2681965 RepID=A0A6L6U904_9FLAO|nr:DUF547 domain-containing protein [Winogradskyella endarachnes]MUU78775.1 DUF547 domain-containing protein [Winogradskyella endarachnes]